VGAPPTYPPPPYTLPGPLCGGYRKRNHPKKFFAKESQEGGLSTLAFQFFYAKRFFMQNDFLCISVFYAKNVLQKLYYFIHDILPVQPLVFREFQEALAVASSA
jgi:hypothetical protein